MSRFLFNEFIIEAVCADMETMNANIAESEQKIRQANEKLSKLKGFGSEGIATELEETSGKRILYTEDFQKAISVLRDVRGTVEKYTNMSFSGTYRILDYAKLSEENNSFKMTNSVFKKYTFESDDFVDKYCGGWNTVFSQIKNALSANIKGKNFEEYMIETTLKDIINNSAGDFSFYAGNDYLDRIITDNSNARESFADLFLSEETQKSLNKNNPLKEASKLYEEMKYDSKIVTMLANDYNDNLEYLYSLKRCLAESGYDSKTVDKVFNNIISDYEHKYWATAKDVLNKVGTDLLEEAIEKNLIGKTVLTALDIMEKGDIKGEDKMKYSTIMTYENDFVNAYNELGKKISSGDYTERDLMDFKNMFEICRTTEIKKYESALEFVILPEERELCKEAIEYYTNLKIE